MKDFKYPNHPTRHGYMTEKTQRNYIASAIIKNLLPANAHRIPEIVSLDASNNSAKPVQFWQLHSVLGQEPIVRIVENFYERVFADEAWFTSVFERVGGIGHHINTQASMWVDVMGGGPYYHCADFQLSFHHTHNAIQLMNDKGAQRWSQLMRDTLEESAKHMTDDPRIRTSINTFLAHFMVKYSDDFEFKNRSFFGETNPTFKQTINFMQMSTEAIEALSEAKIRGALTELGVDVTPYISKKDLVDKVLML